MFDIGFSELVVLFIVGLIVLGPQRLPVAIRTVMGWVRTIRGLAANVQNELSQELKLQELQESIKKAEHLNLQQLSPELNKTVEELRESAQKIKADLEKKAAETNTSFEQQAKALKAAIQSSHSTAAENAAKAVAPSIEERSKVQQVEDQSTAATAPVKIQPAEHLAETSSKTTALSPEEQAELAEQADPITLSATQYYPEDEALMELSPSNKTPSEKS
ncbi:twin-arginine translocase subunit TatB [Actinobacillus seminis]|uniref:Sec-independent protein translocase protein TatB n=1 Tax=Actinobacillus seminis TaxID=722 RepID=A0A263HCJ6_9PAST|nr:Sec-independent protein translocase protein TatB [Actinobacillus seminis]OZN25160.1 twin-arginine translocase subunit TatB [Actinobacillus seminis]SUU33935.1 sec-independent translocase [Actinobacillus seminis]